MRTGSEPTLWPSSFSMQAQCINEETLSVMGRSSKDQINVDDAKLLQN